MKELKFLYESIVLKEIEEKTVEKKEENGQTVEISRTIKKSKPIKIAILKPNRKLFEGAEKFYAIQMAELIRAGLLPYSLVAKRYANDGGPLNEEDKSHLLTLRKEVSEIEGEYFKTIGNKDADPKVKNDFLLKINGLNNEIANLQNAYSDIFENTAEFKARNKTIEWWVLHLSYIDEDGTGFKALFGDGDHNSKLDVYDEYTDLENKFTNECIRKLSYLISFWFAAKSNLSKIEFENMDKMYQESLTDYKVVTDEIPQAKIELIASP